MKAVSGLVDTKDVDGVEFIEEPEIPLVDLWTLENRIYHLTSLNIYLPFDKVVSIQPRGRAVHIDVPGHTYKLVLRNETEVLAFVARWKQSVKKFI